MQRKIHNQTLFVAALSVYIGLLIVGAPPQVLAQSLIKQEVSKCGGISEETENLRGIKLVKPLEELAQDLQKLIQIQKFNLQYDDSFFSLTQEFAETNSGRSYYTTRNSSNRWVDLVIQDAIEKIRVDGLTKLPDFLNFEDSQQLEKRQSLGITIGKNSFEISISFKKYSSEEARKLANNLTQAFAANACEETQAKAKQVYENTKCTFENDQVFIVTRLPRAGLEAILKGDEKAN